MADLLIPYLKGNGYNYIEIMPLCEHPCDGSWGYQVTGFFSPTSRYGSPTDLKRFVDRCHQSGIGVIIDFVPVHFAVDDYALRNYDGTPLYEEQGDGHNNWGSCPFNHSQGHVRSFLQSAANFWLSEYHFDGIRMDAVSNLIYWQGDSGRGENHAGIHFLRQMNSGLKHLHPTAILAAEDSTIYRDVTKAVSQGGLGFDYKWNMGWTHDSTLNRLRNSETVIIES
jgi:1,4-alpha-glucan branching enzyme